MNIDNLSCLYCDMKRKKFINFGSGTTNVLP